MSVEGQAARGGVLASSLAVLAVITLIGAEHISHPAASWVGLVVALAAIAGSGAVLVRGRSTRRTSHR
jgi:hypothetical protein